jgi:hypothetical protein
VYFKFCLFFLILFNSFSELSSQDLLEKRILRYNKVLEPSIKVDSNKVFFNLNFNVKSAELKSNIEIIKIRKQSKGNKSFMWLLIFLLVFSFIRYYSGSSYREILSNFFAFKRSDKNHFSVAKNFMTVISFITLFSYLIYLLLKAYSPILASNIFYLNIVFSILCLLIYRYVMYHLVIYVFSFKNKITDVRLISFNVMYIFVFISLPALFLTTLVNEYVKNSILIGVLITFFFILAFMYYKIFIINSYLLTRHVFKSIIYFYIVEIIPILLFLKYLKLL